MPVEGQIICPVFIGRASQVELLGRLVATLGSGLDTPHVAVLAGEAGIGKSRLVREMKALAAQRGYLIVQGICFEYDRHLPYAPVLDLLRFFLTTKLPENSVDLISPFGPELLKLMPEFMSVLPNTVPAPALEPAQEKRRLFDALVNLLAGLAASRPLLIIVEDLHWSDEVSLEFLRYLTHSIASSPILLLLTYRSDEADATLQHFLADLDRARLAVEVSLAPLTMSEVNDMLRAILRLERPARAELLDAIFSLSDGNPFFIEEILKELLSTGALAYGDPKGDLGSVEKLHIPRTVQDAVQRRSKRLSDAARKLLSLAAVAGHRFNFTLLEQVAHHEEGELLALVKELIQAQLVVEESADQFAFRHALTRTAVYSDLLARERRTLHAEIARAIETLHRENLQSAAQSADVSDLAHHFYMAGIWPETLKYAQWAGEKAHTLYAPREAVEHFTHALVAAFQLGIPVPPRIYRGRAQAYEILGDFEHAQADYEEALADARQARDVRAEWQALIDLGFLWAAKDYSRTGDYFREAMKLARTSNEPVLLARSLNRVGNWLVNTGATAEALQVHHEALGFFEAQGDKVGIAETFDLLGMANFLHGDMPAARDYSRRAIDRFLELSDRRGPVSDIAVINASVAFADTGPWLPLTQEDCEREARRALDLAQQSGWLAGQAQTDWAAGIALSAFGDLGRALTYAREALRIATSIEHWQWMCAAYATLGHIQVLLLQPDKALANLEQGLRFASRLGSSFWIGSITTELALAHVLKGASERAEAALRGALPALGLSEDWHYRLPRNLPERRLKWAWAKVALAQGHTTMALTIVEQLLVSIPGNDKSQPIPALMHVKGDALAALDRLDDAVQALSEGIMGAQKRQARPMVWTLHRSLGHVYRKLSRREQARREYASARECVLSLAATIDEEDERQTFLQLALATLPEEKPASARRAAKSQFGGLTERERNVAALVAQGKSNREIAEELILSKRTIEVHIGNIMAKLAFTTRTQIAVWAVEQGLLDSASD